MAETIVSEQIQMQEKNFRILKQFQNNIQKLTEQDLYWHNGHIVILAVRLKKLLSSFRNHWNFSLEPKMVEEYSNVKR